MIAAERVRQLSVEGWTAEHDDTHKRWELSRAALCYLREAKGRGFGSSAPREWPWSEDWWKPEERITDLVKAGALIAAEIDRLQRAGYLSGRP
jgi:hypothetical protein